MKDIYERMAEIARKFNIATVMATQANRRFSKGYPRDPLQHPDVIFIDYIDVLDLHRKEKRS